MPNHVGDVGPGVTGAEESNIDELASERVDHNTRTAVIVGWRIEDLAVTKRLDDC